MRSSDGHVAQHVNPKNVGFHAGNWYVNMHSVGIEHEGFAATGATWYTESMYRSSAALVKHLATKYGIPLDRAHIIGHDQVPGITHRQHPRHALGPRAVLGLGALHGAARCAARRPDRAARATW